MFNFVVPGNAFMFVATKLGGKRERKGRELCAVPKLSVGPRLKDRNYF